jgi:hypothetical protein
MTHCMRTISACRVPTQRLWWLPAKAGSSSLRTWTFPDFWRRSPQPAWIDPAESDLVDVQSRPTTAASSHTTAHPATVAHVDNHPSRKTVIMPLVVELLPVHLPRQPFPLVQANLNGEGKPGLDACVHPSPDEWNSGIASNIGAAARPAPTILSLRSSPGGSFCTVPRN